jgi:hypothetical protein
VAVGHNLNQANQTSRVQALLNFQLGTDARAPKLGKHKKLHNARCAVLDWLINSHPALHFNAANVKVKEEFLKASNSASGPMGELPGAVGQSQSNDVISDDETDEQVDTAMQGAKKCSHAPLWSLVIDDGAVVLDRQGHPKPGVDQMYKAKFKNAAGESKTQWCSFQALTHDLILMGKQGITILSDYFRNHPGLLPPTQMQMWKEMLEEKSSESSGDESTAHQAAADDEVVVNPPVNAVIAKGGLLRAAKVALMTSIANGHHSMEEGVLSLLVDQAESQAKEPGATFEGVTAQLFAQLAKSEPQTREEVPGFCKQAFAALHAAQVTTTGSEEAPVVSDANLQGCDHGGVSDASTQGCDPEGGTSDAGWPLTNEVRCCLK